MKKFLTVIATTIALMTLVSCSCGRSSKTFADTDTAVVDTMAVDTAVVDTMVVDTVVVE